MESEKEELLLKRFRKITLIIVGISVLLAIVHDEGFKYYLSLMFVPILIENIIMAVHYFKNADKKRAINHIGLTVIFLVAIILVFIKN